MFGKKTTKQIPHIAPDAPTYMREYFEFVSRQLNNPLVAVQAPTTATEVKLRAEEAARAMPRRDPNTGRPLAEDMITMRLRWLGAHDNSFDYSPPWRHMSAYYDLETAVVMVVTNKGKSVMLEDDAGLFPSDTLIIQLRMLIETGGE